MSITRYCAELLEAGNLYHVHYGDRLANHLPMVLIALDKLGASREQLQHAFDRSAPHLQLRVAASAEPIADIKDCRNREELFSSALLYYQQQLQQLGISGCLQQELPSLLPAIATAAFHALIRTAYGIDAGHQQEIAMGLAYWNLDYRTLQSSAEQIPGPAAGILPQLAKHYPQISLAPGNIADHMSSVSGQPDWMDTPIQPQQLGLEDIARVAITAYNGTRDFTLLHGVTGCHALRLILPYCPEPQIALRHFWTGLVVAYLSTGPKAIRKMSEKQRPKDVAARQKSLSRSACESDDDHVIKLGYSCLQEYDFYQNQDYLIRL